MQVLTEAAENGQRVNIMNLTLQAVSSELRNGVDMFLTRELAKSVVMTHFIILSSHHKDFHVFFIRKEQSEHQLRDLAGTL